MNVLVYPHELVMGGSQINAIELAAAVHARGHRVVVTAPEGPLTSMIEDLGLDFVPAPVGSFNPSVRNAWHLIKLARERQIDLIHAYEWRPSMEAAFGAHLLNRVPMLMTVLSMSVSASMPSHLPLVVGTHELFEKAPADQKTWLMEPPIDTEKNRSDDIQEARARLGLEDDRLIVSVVCRLAHEHEKLEGVVEAIGVIDEMAGRWPVQFLIVGDGEGKEQVERAARAVNRRHGSNVIVPAGQLLDPRDAYAASDIVLGMGSSALKGMAFSKPLVVQGTSGFWRLLDEQSLEMFLQQGWFGQGGGGARDLREALEPLLADTARRAALGGFGRRLVEERFSLEKAADRLMEIYDDTVTRAPSMSGLLPSMTRSAVELSKFRTIMGLRAYRDAILRVRI